MSERIRTDLAPGTWVTIGGHRMQVSEVKVVRSPGGGIKNKAEWRNRRYGR